MESPVRVLVGKESKQQPEEGAGPRGRKLQVSGSAEVRCPADRASLRLSLSSRKESVSEASSSVSRRLDYTLQSLREHSISDEAVSVRKFTHSDGDLYCLDAEVVVTFSNFDKMNCVCCHLLEKLGKSISLGTPQFYHSAECLRNMRTHAYVSAVENAQQKAIKVSQLLGQSLGPPLQVREEETKEGRMTEEGEDRNQGSGPSHLPHIPTIAASSQVSVSFSLRDRSRK